MPFGAANRQSRLLEDTTGGAYEDTLAQPTSARSRHDPRRRRLQVARGVATRRPLAFSASAGALADGLSPEPEGPSLLEPAHPAHAGCQSSQASALDQFGGQLGQGHEDKSTLPHPGVGDSQLGGGHHLVAH